MINGFGEDISQEKIKEIAERIIRLPDNLIDELWFRCDLVYEKPKSIAYPDANKYYKALYDDIFEEIREEKEFSHALWTLLMETPLGSVLQNLDDVEKKMQKSD
jgi:hypothetical protein